ncbi:nuclease [Cellulosimicrobium cellulans]|uniref:nuclease n=1 Tax=Cellulosimicrobium cellulans TaxID=1710 RepID=UPI00130E73C4|nr:nuclease [Cellulosimicrobium cellulans]
MPQHTRVDVLPVQEVVATASPSAWRDGLVVAQGDAQVTVALLDGDLRVLTTRATPQPGEPVAVHPVAGLLALGGVWYAARPSV